MLTLKRQRDSNLPDAECYEQAAAFVASMLRDSDLAPLHRITCERLDALLEVLDRKRPPRFRIGDILYATSAEGQPIVGTVVEIYLFDDRWRYVIESESAVRGVFFEFELYDLSTEDAS